MEFGFRVLGFRGGHRGFGSAAAASRLQGMPAPVMCSPALNFWWRFPSCLGFELVGFVVFSFSNHTQIRRLQYACTATPNPVALYRLS